MSCSDSGTTKRVVKVHLDLDTYNALYALSDGRPISRVVRGLVVAWLQRVKP